MDGGPYVELNGGARMPVLGLGVWQMEAGHQTEQAVEWALEAGYRHIDTAAFYKNEQSVGVAIKRSGLPRDEIFVTTKLMPYKLNTAHELEESLEKLQLAYVDLYLIHWPMPTRSAAQWRDLESLHERGLAREIGVSNFGVKRLAKLMSGTSRPPAVNQVQFSPFQYRRRVLEFCRENGVAFEAYSPLARGAGLEDPVIRGVADRVARTPAQVMLRWAIQHGAVVIPKSTDRDRIRSNAQVFDFELGDADMRELDGLDRTNGTARARG
jgi:diketogulonate reductase-like aldo/keto reductase